MELGPLFDMAKTVRPVKGARMCAGIFHRSRLLALGVSQKKSHPLQARFAHRPDCIYLHAEVAAIVNFLQRHPPMEMVGKDMVVVRAKRGQAARWVMGASRPCPGCRRALEHYGLSTVTFWENGKVLEYV